MNTENNTGELDDFANFLDLHPHVLWTADPTGRVTLSGTAWTLVAGASPVQDWALFIHPDDRPQARAAWERSVASGQPYDVEYRFRRGDEYVWVRSRARAAKSADARVLRWYGSSENIHDRKLLQLKLEAERFDAQRKLAELEVLYRTAPIGLAVIDRNLRFVRINDFLAQINGAPAEAHVGRTVSEMVPDLAEQATAVVKDVLETGRARLDVEIEGSTPAAPGEQRTWLENWQPISGSDGRPDGVSVVALDITERRRLLTSLREDEAKKSRFLAMVAHELRNALAPTLTAVEFLKRERSTGASLDSAVDIIERAGLQQAALIRDLFDLSGVDRAASGLDRHPVPLSRVLDGASAAVQELFERRSQRFIVMPPRTEVWLDADAVRLHQVFFNLLSNASKYTEYGGTIELSAEVAGGWVNVQVKDSGIGIPGDRLDTVFDLFSRGDHPWHSAVEGLGIGLAVVKRLTELHGGSVRALSDGVGLGSTFEVRLPVQTDARQFVSSHAPGQS